ncbi:MAG: type I-C CRISPR-associated endonuclease Cas1 [Chloroflexi bacterium]|nr:type I-C CRISPR-associated endonuclease Cas1 [Chloroflexota bacterium]
MKRLLNTLYVTTPGAYLSRDGETVLVRVEDEVKLQLPIHTIGSIICFGVFHCSPSLLALCADRSVAVSFFSTNGRFMSRLEGRLSGNVLLRREQYRRADSASASSTIARSILIAKLANSRAVLMRAARDQPDKNISDQIKNAADQVNQHLASLDPVLDTGSLSLDDLRGHEGDSAHAYYNVFDLLITAQKEDFVFGSRNRRPPMDNVNALLSFLYTVLANDVASALSGVGLDPAVGYLHRDRPGRPGLALDIMEEFRAYLADRLTLTLINLRQVKGEGFQKTESGAVRMDDATRKTVLTEYQKRKQEEIIHPFLNEKAAIGLLPHIQAMLLARHLRGELDAYPPFILK